MPLDDAEQGNVTTYLPTAVCVIVAIAPGQVVWKLPHWEDGCMTQPGSGASNSLYAKAQNSRTAAATGLAPKATSTRRVLPERSRSLQITDFMASPGWRGAHHPHALGMRTPRRSRRQIFHAACSHVAARSWLLHLLCARDSRPKPWPVGVLGVLASSPR